VPRLTHGSVRARMQVLAKLYAKEEASNLLRETMRRVLKGMRKLTTLKETSKPTKLAAEHIRLTCAAGELRARGAEGGFRPHACAVRARAVNVWSQLGGGSRDRAGRGGVCEREDCVAGARRPAGHAGARAAARRAAGAQGACRAEGAAAGEAARVAATGRTYAPAAMRTAAFLRTSIGSIFLRAPSHRTERGLCVDLFCWQARWARPSS
jgi:hypothetical protein